MNERKARVEQAWCKQLIGGKWVDAIAGGTWDVIDPATEEVVATVPFGGAEDCRAAIDAAHGARTLWAQATAYQRAEVLMGAAMRVRAQVDEIAELTVRESGKPLAQARGELLVAAQLFEWYAEEGKRLYGRTIPTRSASRRSMVIYEPIGVVGVITAWNFPAYNPARAWAAALAAGCTVVARASELTPLTAMWLAKVLADSGLPPGVLNLVNGDPHATGQVMLEDPRCRKIGFTGSVRVGRILMDGASRTFTRLSLELGGNAPVIVCDDVDVDAVARGAVAAKFRNAGQVCIAPQRFLVQRSVYDAFASKVVEYTKAVQLGHGLDEGVQMGPLINARQRQRLMDVVAEAKEQGASILHGGRIPAGRERGFFFEPTVLSKVHSDMRVYCEELFGPVMPLTPFDSLGQALAMANDTEYGLAAFVFTRDLGRTVEAYETLDFGMVAVNDWSPQSTELPFAARKHSGFGFECSAEGLLDYVEAKSVTLGGLLRS